MNPLLTPPPTDGYRESSRRCEVTRNPCGTDTWGVDSDGDLIPCECARCQAYLDDKAGDQNQRAADELARRKAARR